MGWNHKSGACIFKMTDLCRKGFMRLKIPTPFSLYFNGIVLFVKREG
jgi:hypothetical protein